jgi:hypothetical protein
MLIRPHLRWVCMQEELLEGWVKVSWEETTSEMSAVEMVMGMVLARSSQLEMLGYETESYILIDWRIRYPQLLRRSCRMLCCCFQVRVSKSVVNAVTSH